MGGDYVEGDEPFSKGDLAVFKDGAYGNREYLPALGALVPLTIRESVDLKVVAAFKWATGITVPS